MGTICSVKSYNKCSKCSLSALTQAHDILLFVYCPVDNTLFEVSPPKTRCLGVCQVAAVAMETTQLVLSQFKSFYPSQLN